MIACLFALHFVRFQHEVESNFQLQEEFRAGLYVVPSKYGQRDQGKY